jgi:outer membrane protein OmpA-like peptidoglycan-associated protein
VQNKEVMMGKKVVVGAIMLLAFSFIVAGTGITSYAEGELPEEFSWYGESGATREPIYDEQKVFNENTEGLWWMPEKAPEGQENIQWGNRGYVFVGTKKEVVEPPPAPPKVEPVRERVVEKIVYRDRVVEKPVEKIVYRDRVVEKPVEKIVYRDRVVEKAAVINLKDVYFEWDSSKLTSLALLTLKENADVLRANPKVNVLLVGSASPEGESDYNLKLSERRVTTVKDYLVSKENISASRLQTKAAGEISVDETSWPFVRKVGFSIAK